jgi:glycerol kinase
VPAFVGLGAPYWDPHARGAVTGLTRGAGRNHIIRATLEAIAYQTVDLIRAMEKDSGIKLKNLKVDGGASANNFLMQFQSNVIGTKVRRPACLETTALGAAYLAGLAVGYWRDQDEILKNWVSDAEFKPAYDEMKVKNLLVGWHRAVESVRSHS